MKVVFKQHLFVKESDVGTLIFRKDETTQPAKSSLTHEDYCNGYTDSASKFPVSLQSCRQDPNGALA